MLPHEPPKYDLDIEEIIADLKPVGRDLLDQKAAALVRLQCVAERHRTPNGDNPVERRAALAHDKSNIIQELHSLDAEFDRFLFDVNEAGQELGWRFYEVATRPRLVSPPWLEPQTIGRDLAVKDMVRKARWLFRRHGGIDILTHLEQLLTVGPEEPQQVQQLNVLAREYEARKVFAEASPKRRHVCDALLAYADKLQRLYLSYSGRFQESEHLEELVLLPAAIVVLGRMHSEEFDSMFFYFERDTVLRTKAIAKGRDPQRGRNSEVDPPNFPHKAFKELGRKLLGSLSAQKLEHEREVNVFTQQNRVKLARAILRGFGASEQAVHGAFRYLGVPEQDEPSNS